ncbi:MAG: alpha-D-ribose 1-methylphosphonate 5-triphosphate diphosphatase [Hyphomicrobiales bacterium]
MPAKPAPTAIVLRGGKVLLESGEFSVLDVLAEDGCIARLGTGLRCAGALELDASGCLVLPGIVDIHGDAFERNIMPRPRVMFALETAMLESDRQLASNGITTGYHGVTVSWEPGLRCLAEALRIVDAMDAVREQCLIDNRLHIRWENHAIDVVPDVIKLFSRDEKPLLAFNDHTTSGIAGLRTPAKFAAYAEKAMVSVEDYIDLMRTAATRVAEVPAATNTLAQAARSMGIAMLSHDDKSAAMRASYRALGVRVCEFPVTWEAAESAAASGDLNIFGAPNVVRGGSHYGALSASEAVRRGLCHMLASDYYYSAPLLAALTLAGQAFAHGPGTGHGVGKSAMAARSAPRDRGVLARSKRRADVIVLPEGRT